MSLPDPVLRLIEELQRLPGIGPKGAQRLAFHILKTPREPIDRLVTALRADHHSALRDLVLEPRLGVVYKAGRMHAVRLTYNHA